MPSENRHYPACFGGAESTSGREATTSPAGAPGNLTHLFLDDHSRDPGIRSENRTSCWEIRRPSGADALTGPGTRRLRVGSTRRPGRSRCTSGRRPHFCGPPLSAERASGALMVNCPPDPRANPKQIPPNCETSEIVSLHGNRDENAPPLPCSRYTLRLVRPMAVPATVMATRSASRGRSICPAAKPIFLIQGSRPAG